MKPRGLGQCSRCPNERDGAGRFCKSCRAAYMRDYRAATAQRKLEHDRAACVKRNRNLLKLLAKVADVQRETSE